MFRFPFRNEIGKVVITAEVSAALTGGEDKAASL